MTERGLPIVDGAPACPFVAYEDDRDGRGQAPDHRHRCFAEPRPAPRALAHQEAYCLSSAFPVCPTFQDWARREAATARAAELEAATPTPEIVPVSQSLPPREREPRHAPSTDTPPPLPPRRNPPRDWAAPPPWTGEPGDEPVDPPPFLADRSSEASADRAAEVAAYGAASRGLAGSAADRLAGPYSDEPYVDPPGGHRPPAAARDDDDDELEPAASVAPVAAAAAPPARAPDPVPPSSARWSSQPPGSQPGRGASQAAPARKPAAAPKQSQDAANLFGPAWERQRRYEAYPSLRTRVGIPGMGSPPRIVVAAVALVLAAVVLFFVGPMLLGLGKSGSGPGPGATASAPAGEVTPSPLATKKPAPTPKVYVVARGDTMLKIARKFGVTVEQLLAANPKIKNPNKIVVGDQVIIPVPVSGSGSARPSGSVSGASAAP